MIEFLKYFFPLSIISNGVALLFLYLLVVFLGLFMRMPITSVTEFFQISYESNILTVVVVVCIILSIVFGLCYKMNIK